MNPTPRLRSADLHPRASEPLWTLDNGGRRVTCELRDDGAHGCEAQLLRDSAFYAGRRFADRAQALAHTELGCKQKLRIAVNDRLGIEPDAA